MKNILFAASLALAAPFASATNENCTNRHSQAYCILDLVNLSTGAFEISAADLEKNLKQAGAWEPGSKVLDHGINLFSVLTSKGGLETALAGGVSILNLFIDPGTVGGRPQFFIMLPESKAQDGNPRLTAESVLMAAVTKALGIEQSELREVEKKPTFGSAYTYREYALKGGQCGEVGCTAFAPFFAYGSDPVVVIDHPPSWAGNERLYVWASPTKGAWPQVKKPGEVRFLITADKMMSVIKNLPEWFYLYLPGKTPAIITSEKVYFLAR